MLKTGQAQERMQVSRRGVEIPKSPAVLQKVRKELTVTPFNPQNPFGKSFRVYLETPSHVVVPLHWARKAFGEELGHTRDMRVLGDPARMEFVGSLKAELRQPEAVESVLASLHAGGGALLCLATGLGKTTCALYVACQLKRKTLIVVHKDFLARQWKERIAQYVPGATVSVVQGSTCDLSGDFVIAMIQTLVNRKYPPSTFAACSLLVWDEVHHAAAHVFSQAMFALNLPYTLGLTATPERKDRLGKVVEWFLGDIAFLVRREGQGTTEVRPRTYTCPRFAEPPPVNRRGDVCFTSTISILAEDEARTRMVASQAAALARSGRDVLVLSHRRAHCAKLCDEVTRQGVACRTYLGGDKDVPESQVVVATYALTSEGFDCPRLSALVLATPSSDVEQACGRVMRGSSSQAAVIVDIVDMWGVCFAQHAKRKAFYRRCGFRVLGGKEETHETQKEYAFLD